ncbi:M23 family metallopeptidase [Nocardia goodfellowii]|uniref:Murein DD-endopeptidase MepM/ murein hydrolase activator NlpD n=1 Tax=Nocardia goodfellowii TaxID=882446 RepID=A0ABS4QK74_9NOCA|nr:M23 family metallopeptidase [Nocardia goodfellowii]MBP2192109.1 murein DD-endopeptidase MepM/ murein hydrolase activator NlpD [Nocardia goodfellowii]
MTDALPPRFWPLAAGTYTITSGFGPRAGGFHYGLDFAAPVGTPCYAPADGVCVEGAERTEVQGFGRWVWLDCQAAVGADFVIGHGDPAVRRGDPVRAGQLIGFVNSHGDSSGPHAHVEVWTAPGRVGGRAIDPAGWFAGAQHPPPGDEELMALTFVNFEGKTVDAATALYWIDRRTQQNEVMLMAILDQLLGPGAGRAVRDRAAQQQAGWPQNGGRSLNDLTAAIAEQLDVPGAEDTAS